MKKVLIIEDDQIVANIYRSKFVYEGFEAEVAADGQTGLETIRRFRPDVVVLDLMLPKLSGVEVMKQVRAEPDFQQLPIIVFSNTYLTNMVQDAWKAGATKCLSKANCTPKQVIDLVQSTLAGGGPTARAAGAPVPAVAHPATPVGAGERPSANDPDAEFQAELRRSFIESWPGSLASMRTLLQGMVKANGEVGQLKQVHELYRRVHALTGNAGITGLQRIAQMADALEALLKELYEKPRNITPSTLRTVAAAVDFLGFLFEEDTQPAERTLAPVNILVVDDEAISRRAVTYALEKARLKSINVEDPQVAYGLLQENRFDLIILDVDMPGMSGFELCARLRQLPLHKKTPVVFVTSLNDFESRANSTVSGGNDFIAKPFLFIELAVKALVYVMRNRFSARQGVPAR